MIQQNLISAALAVLIAVALVLYPQILGSQTTGTLIVLASYITGLLRPQPHNPPNGPAAPPLAD